MVKMDLNQMLNLSIQNVVSAPAQVSAAAENNASNQEKDNSKAQLGIHVDLSPLGLQKSKNAERDKDIDESELPDNVKQALKAIRDKQEELEKKQQELQQLMSNSAMPAEEKQEKLKALQAEISTLSRGLLDSKNNLISSMQDQGLTEQQIQTAMALID
ncbi:hypothetical protein [Rheinheimera sp.]|uniref:hypothetical protein n=1 Tax=Rheinheimera sp. TaxID=1869214 RepID=UPI00260AA601|nr:hypothetical protein [Rheinheimera sp.]MCA1931354.1 hypothetical protein [Rheinheimera sp.]